MVFQWWFRDVSRVFQGSLRVFQESFKGISRKIQGYFKEDSRVFQGSCQWGRLFESSSKGI